MNRVMLSLDLFTLLLSFVGVVLPMRAPLRFLFPHMEASVAGLLLTGYAYYNQVRLRAGKPIRTFIAAGIGVLLSVLTVERFFVSTDTGLINSRVSHADLFIFAALAVTYLLAAIESSVESRQYAAAPNPRNWHWPPLSELRIRHTQRTPHMRLVFHR